MDTLAVRLRVKGVQMRLAGWSPRDRLSECREGQFFWLLLLFTMRVPGIRNYSPGLRAPCGPVSSQWSAGASLDRLEGPVVPVSSQCYILRLQIVCLNFVVVGVFILQESTTDRYK